MITSSKYEIELFLKFLEALMKYDFFLKSLEEGLFHISLIDSVEDRPQGEIPIGM